MTHRYGLGYVYLSSQSLNRKWSHYIRGKVTLVGCVSFTYSPEAFGS